VYSKVNSEAYEPGDALEPDEPGDGVEMETVSPDGAAAPASSELKSEVDPLSDESEVPPHATGVKQEMNHESVVPAMALAYLAFIRGLSLGADVKLVSETELEMLVFAAIGQVCCVSYSLSVFLTDTRLQLSTQASFLFTFSLMAPLGILMGHITLANADHMVVRNVSSFVAGVLLFYTTARILPQESRDAAIMMMRKGNEDMAKLRRTQVSNSFTLLLHVLEWLEMVLPYYQMHCSSNE